MRKFGLFKLWKRCLFRLTDHLVGTDDIPPQRLTFAAESPEIHSLVCKAHLKLYLCAIKSFIRYENRVKVVVHDDGTLSDDDVTLIRRHIEGVRVISKAEADSQVEPLLRNHPHCLRYRRAFVNAKQLFDYSLMCNSPQLIGLDSDVLFLKDPISIRRWIKSGDAILYGYESDPLGANQIEKTLGDVPFVRNVNIGLLCYFKDVLELDLVEDCLARLTSFDWWTGQMVFPVLLAHNARQVEALDPREYTCEEQDDPNMTFKHYCISYGMRRQYIFDMLRFTRQMRRVQ